MTAEEFFGDWIEVIDLDVLAPILKHIGKIKDTNLCPSRSNIFKSFKLCPYKELRVVFIGQD